MSLYVEGDVPYVANGNCGNNNNGWIYDFELYDLAPYFVVDNIIGYTNGRHSGVDIGRYKDYTPAYYVKKDFL